MFEYARDQESHGMRSEIAREIRHANPFMAVSFSLPQRICSRRAFARGPDSGALVLIDGRPRNRDVLARSYNRLAGLQRLYNLGSVLSEPVPIVTLKRIEGHTPPHIRRIGIDGQQLLILGTRVLKAVQIKQQIRATAQGWNAAWMDRQTSVVADQGVVQTYERRKGLAALMPAFGIRGG